jgi:hypothetical protein
MKQAIALRNKLQADSEAYAASQAKATATATGGSILLHYGDGPLPITPGTTAEIIEIAPAQKARQTEVETTESNALPTGKHFSPTVGRPDLETIKRRRKVDEAS